MKASPFLPLRHPCMEEVTGNSALIMCMLWFTGLNVAKSIAVRILLRFLYLQHFRPTLGSTSRQ